MWFGCGQPFLWGSIARHPKKRLRKRLTISGNNEYAINVVQNNTTVLDYDDNSNLLLYKEAFHIKRQSPSLDNGLKSSRELYLFSCMLLSIPLVTI